MPRTRLRILQISMPRTRLRILQISMILLLAASICRGAYADSIKPSDNHVKSAMLFNMIKFVDWPQESLSANAITICVLGKGSFGEVLNAFQGEHLKGRTVNVRHISQGYEAIDCQVLVLGDIDRRLVTSIIERTRQQAVLTVSDMPNFAQAGGVVGFIEQDDKIRFTINTTAAQQHRIRISYQLLKIARIVKDPS